MFEATTTYSLQMPYGIDAKVSCASILGSLTNNNHADTDISTPVSAFFVSENTYLSQISA